MTESRGPVESLQDLVLRRLSELGDQEGPMSAKAAAARSRDRISYETLRLIARGKHGGRIGDRIAEGLSLALDVPISEVYRAAGAPRPQSRWDWPQRFERLDAGQRQLVEEIASALLEAYDRGRRDSQQ